MELELNLWRGQGEALSLILNPKDRKDVMMACGVGGGKTHILCIAATCLAYLNPPGVDGMLAEPIYRMLSDVLRPSLEDFWDANGIPYEWQAGELKYALPDTGNAIWLRSAEKPNHLRGPNLAWIGLDEAAYMRPEVLTVANSRVRHPRANIRRIFGATTPCGFNWLYHHWVDPTRPNAGDTALVTWPTWENKALLEADPDFVERLRRSYTKELFQQEVEGAFLVVGQGRAYHAFNRGKHLKAFELDRTQPLDLCVDFNVAPACWVLSQGGGSTRNPERAIDEISVSGSMSTYTALEEFKARYPEHADGSMVRVYGDASGQSRGTTGLSDFDVIREVLPHAAVYVRSRNPLVKDRLNAVNSLLEDATGRVRAYVHPTKCPRLVRDLEQVSFQRDTFALDKSNQDLTHSSDAWGYKIQWCYPVIKQVTNKRARHG